jgi:hypothetical protein
MADARARGGRQGFSDEAVGFLLSRLELATFDPGDVIYSPGDPAREMFLLVSGRVALRPDPLAPAPARPAAGMAAAAAAAAAACVPPAEAGRGDAFGELGLFPEALGAARREAAVAETWVEAYALRADRVPELHAAHPELVARLRDFCAMRAMTFDHGGGGGGGGGDSDLPRWGGGGGGAAAAGGGGGRTAWGDSGAGCGRRRRGSGGGSSRAPRPPPCCRLLAPAAAPSST